MSEFLDKVFIREFRDMVRSIRTQSQFNINMIHLPAIEESIDTGIKVLIDGIDDKYYGLLNNLYVTKLEQRSVERNIYWNSGEIKGTETFNAGANRLIIRTDCNIKLPFRYISEFDKDLEYIDYRITNLPNGETIVFYYYAIPTKYLYNVTNTALVLSDKKKPKHYGGLRLLTTWGYYIYVYMVNVKGLKDIETQKIIKTGINPRELQNLLPEVQVYLESTEQVFNHTELEVSVPIDTNGSTNLASFKYEATLEYEERTDLSIAEEQMSARQLYEGV